MTHNDASTTSDEKGRESLLTPARQRPDFSAATLVAASTPAAADELIADSLLGLPFQFHTIYGTVRDAAGEMYTLTRRIGRGDGGPMRLILQSTLRGLPHLKLHEAGKSTVRARDCERAIIDDQLVIRSAQTDADQPFVLRRGAQGFEWQEGAAVAIRGVAVGPELKWYLPRPTRRFLYVSQFYWVEGTMLGNPVRGFICFDDTYKGV